MILTFRHDVNPPEYYLQQEFPEARWPQLSLVAAIESVDKLIEPGSNWRILHCQAFDCNRSYGQDWSYEIVRYGEKPRETQQDSSE